MNSRIFIAFLRGINVGRAKRVAMADLRSVVEELGFGNVRTLLNSGNVVFSAPPRTDLKKAAAALEAGLVKKTGVDSRITVITSDEIEGAIENNVLLDLATNHSRFLVGVARDTESLKRLDAIAKQEWSPDAIAIHGRFVFLWCTGGILESKLAASVNKTLGDAVTMRNWATILKIGELARKT